MIIEVGITSQDPFQIVERRKYDVLANEMGAVHKCKTRIIPYVLTWDGIVTKFQKTYAKEIGLTKEIQAYIQFVVLKKTLESISFEYRRGGDETEQESLERAIAASAEGCEPTEASASVDAGTIEV